MLEALVFGGGFALAAALQPGPFQAFLFARVAAVGWRRTMPAAFAPLLSDGPIAVLVLLFLGQLPEGAFRLLRGAGGLLLLWLAWGGLRRWRAAQEETAAPAGSVPRTLLEAAAVNALGPGPYLGWSLVLGPAALAAWSRRPAEAVALVGSFYGVMVATQAALIVAFGSVQFLGAGGRRALLALSAFLLAALGVFQLVMALAG